MQILIADDDEGTRLFAAKALEAAGHTVSACADGQAAFQLLQGAATPFDVLITDVQMPELSGDELAARARSQNAAIRVLYISGFEAELDRVQATADANTARLLKPFTLESLREAVAQLTSG
ncbi:MAG: response regulator [Pseudomonadota bacterium]